MSGHLAPARTQVLEWLRVEYREPEFLAGETDAMLDLRHGEITQHFLKWAKSAGFAYEVIDVGGGGQPAYEVHWTHRGSSFVGFKQPPPETREEDALLAACAALLDNQWCQEWLDE